MRLAIVRWIAFFLFPALAACDLEAQDPDDLSLGLRLTKNPPEYHAGEPIAFEISLSSSAVRKYYADSAPLMPGLGARVILESAKGAVDVSTTGHLLDFISNPPAYLTAKPIIETGDLTQWYRFDKPGRFQVSVAVDWVSRVKTAEEGGGKEASPIGSNTVEFEILPPDPAWEEEELQSALHELDHASDLGARALAAHRLSLLQTPAAAAEEVRRFLAGVDRDYSFYYVALLNSSLLDQIIPALESALTDPAVDPPPGIVDLLVRLQGRKQMEDPQALTDAAGQKMQKIVLERTKARFFAQYSKILLDTIRQRSGPERLNTEFEAWSNAERQYAGTAPTPAVLNDLRIDLLRAEDELSPQQATQFLVSAWYVLPHAELLPLVRRLALMPGSGFGARAWAFKFWCEDWPSDCKKAILADARKPHSDLQLEAILRIPASEQPDLDAIFEEKLANPDSFGRDICTAAFISRAGTRNIRAAVDAFLDKQAANQFRNWDIEGYLLAYLFRVAPRDAARRLVAVISDRTPFRGYPAFRALSHSERFENVIPLAIAALHSANLNTAGASALFLAEHSSEPARSAIAQRLDELRTQWRDHTSEIKSAVFGDTLWDVAQFERNLVSALAHAQAWKLSGEEEESLAEDCFTDQCRQIAQGSAREQL